MHGWCIPTISLVVAALALALALTVYIAVPLLAIWLLVALLTILRVVALLAAVILLLLILGSVTTTAVCLAGSEAGGAWRETGSGGTEASSLLVAKVHLLSLASQVVILGSRVILPRLLNVV